MSYEIPQVPKKESDQAPVEETGEIIENEPSFMISLEEWKRLCKEHGISPEKGEMTQRHAVREVHALKGVLEKIPAGKKIALGLAGLTFVGALGGAVSRVEGQERATGQSSVQEMTRKIGEAALREWVGKGIANDLFTTLEARDFSNGKGEAMRKKAMRDTIEYQLKNIPRNYEGGKAPTSSEETRVMIGHIGDHLARLDQQKYKNYSDRPELLQKNMRSLIEILKEMRSEK